jgi:hypothetical protein
MAVEETEKGKEMVMVTGGARGDNDGDCDGGSGNDGDDEDDSGGSSGGGGREGEPKNTARVTARDQLQSN